VPRGTAKRVHERLPGQGRPVEVDEQAAESREAEEVAWRTAVDAAPWLLGDKPERSVPPEQFFEKLTPFKELVAEDIKDSEDAS
jgi:hypothetical protein